jgi:PIN domain nuclease of toxin-antitoxin system
MVGPLSSVLVLDTHVWVKFVAGASLSKRARQAIERATSSRRGILIPTISLWEIARLAQDGRVKLGERPERWFDAALATVSGSLSAITAEIAWWSFESRSVPARCSSPEPPAARRRTEGRERSVAATS